MHKHKSLSATIALLTLAYGASYAVAVPSIDIGDSSSLVAAGAPCNIALATLSPHYIQNGTSTVGPVGQKYEMTRKVIAEANACFCHCLDEDGNPRVQSSTSLETTETVTRTDSTGWSWDITLSSVVVSGSIGGSSEVSEGQELSFSVPPVTLYGHCRSKQRKFVAINKQRERTSMNAFVAQCWIEPPPPIPQSETWHTDTSTGQIQPKTIHYDKWKYTPTLLQSVAVPCAASDMLQ